MAPLDSQYLRHWRVRYGYTVVGLAEALGVGRRTLQRYLSGQSSIPRAIELALEALANREGATAWRERFEKPGVGPDGG